MGQDRPTVKINNGICQPPFMPPVSAIIRSTNQLAFLSQVTKTLSESPQAALFLHPVDTVRYGIPHYFDVVKSPMDLGTIRKRLQHRFYRSSSECIADYRTMFQNCFLFNHCIDYAYLQGQGLSNEFERHLKMMPLTEYELSPRTRKDSFTSSSDRSALKDKQNLMASNKLEAKINKNSHPDKQRSKKKTRKHKSSNTNYIIPFEDPSQAKKPKIELLENPSSNLWKDEEMNAHFENNTSQLKINQECLQSQPSSIQIKTGKDDEPKVKKIRLLFNRKSPAFKAETPQEEETLAVIVNSPKANYYPDKPVINANSDTKVKFSPKIIFEKFTDKSTESKNTEGNLHLDFKELKIKKERLSKCLSKSKKLRNKMKRCWNPFVQSPNNSVTSKTQNKVINESQQQNYKNNAPITNTPTKSVQNIQGVVKDNSENATCSKRKIPHTTKKAIKKCTPKIKRIKSTDKEEASVDKEVNPSKRSFLIKGLTKVNSPQPFISHSNKLIELSEDEGIWTPSESMTPVSEKLISTKKVAPPTKCETSWISDDSSSDSACEDIYGSEDEEYGYMNRAQLKQLCFEFSILLLEHISKVIGMIKKKQPSLLKLNMTGDEFTIDFALARPSLQWQIKEYMQECHNTYF